MLAGFLRCCVDHLFRELRVEQVDIFLQPAIVAVTQGHAPAFAHHQAHHQGRVVADDRIADKFGAFAGQGIECLGGIKACLGDNGFDTKGKAIGNKTAIAARGGTGDAGAFEQNCFETAVLAGERRGEAREATADNADVGGRWSGQGLMGVAGCGGFIPGMRGPAFHRLNVMLQFGSLQMGQA